MKLSVVLFSLAVAQEGSGSEKPQRHPARRVNKLEEKFNGMVFEQFGEQNPNWTERMQSRFTRICNKVRDDFDKKNAACNLYDETTDEGAEEDVEDLAERADMQNPCKAAHQLTRNLSRWAAQWSIPCGDRTEKEPKFAGKVDAWMTKITDSVEKRARCDEMEIVTMAPGTAAPSNETER